MRPANISVGGASNYYYERDPVFNPERDQANAEWRGKGAEALGLQPGSTIEKADFENVINGRDPRTGEQLVPASTFNGEKRAGVDIPMGAPPGVSYAALVLKDERLIEAHKEAVRETLAKMEKEASFTRNQSGGKCTQELQGNLCVASFTHSMNRNNEAFLHTHNVIANMVQQPDGSHKALSADAIFRDQQLWTKMYQSNLAVKVHTLGYAIETKANGTWDIGGYMPEVKAEMSTRNAEVHETKESMRAEHPNTADAKLEVMAQRESRNEKDKHMTAEKFDQLNAERQERSGRTFGEQRQALHEAAQQAKEAGKDLIPKNEYDTVREAVQQLQTNESCWSKPDVMKQSIQNSFGRHTTEQLDKAFNDIVEDRELVKRGQERDSRGNIQAVYTTPEQLKAERSNVQHVEEQKGQARVVFDRDDVKQFIAEKEAQMTREEGKKWEYTQGQRATIENITCSKDGVVLVQGDAGTGKTKCMAAVKEYADRHNVPVVAVSFTGKAAAQIQADAGIESHTIHSYIEKKDRATGGIMIIDENSMTDAKLGRELLTQAKEDNMKVVFAGDIQQKSSIGAGRFFQDLQEHTTVDRTELTESKRFDSAHQQDTVASLKKAGKEFKAGNIENIKQHTDTALDRIGQAENLHEIAEPVKQKAKAEELYFAATDNGQTSIIITKTNAQRHEINQEIHTARQQKGEIDHGETCTVRDPVSIHESKRAIADAYKEGWQIRANSDIEGLKRGGAAEITGVDRVNNTVTYQPASGEAVTVQASELRGSKITAYEYQEREFSVGDRVIFLENDKKLGVKNGEAGELTRLDDRGNATVRLDRGAEKTFNVSETQELTKGIDAKYRYDKIDHAYAGTVEKTQGGTWNQCVGIRPENYNDLNTIVTRARQDSHIITGNIEETKDRCGLPQQKTSNLDYEKTKTREVSHPTDLKKAQEREAQKKPTTPTPTDEDKQPPTDPKKTERPKQKNPVPAEQSLSEINDIADKAKQQYYDFKKSKVPESISPSLKGALDSGRRLARENQIELAAIEARNVESTHTVETQTAKEQNKEKGKSIEVEKTKEREREYEMEM